MAFGSGALLCLLNFYLSFLRHPLHRLRGLPAAAYRPVSGFPLVGSLLIALSLIGLHEVAWMIPVSLVLIVIDTGGIHWFLGSMLYRFVHARKRG
jgi:hypothetical protein